MIEKLLTTKQLSERFGVTGKTIYNWRQEGMPFKKYGKLVRFDLKEVEVWLEKRNGGKK